ARPRSGPAAGTRPSRRALSHASVRHRLECRGARRGGAAARSRTRAAAAGAGELSRDVPGGDRRAARGGACGQDERSDGCRCMDLARRAIDLPALVRSRRAEVAHGGVGGGNAGDHRRSGGTAARVSSPSWNGARQRAVLAEDSCPARLRTLSQIVCPGPAPLVVATGIAERPARSSTGARLHPGMIDARSTFVRSGLLALALAMLAACSGGEGGGERGAPEVGYVVVQPSAVPVSVTLAGRTVAYETSEVRPQITGLIRRRLFIEGSVVRAGQPLYQIDPSLYRAAVNQAEANLASARASAEAATARADRYKPLAEMEAIAQQDYTDAAAQAQVARAAVAQNAAALETARINLRYTTVTAPISGRIGRSLSTVGALVSANQQEPLAVIQRLDPIYVDMQQSSAELTSLRQALQRGDVASGSTSVRLTL